MIVVCVARCLQTLNATDGRVLPELSNDVLHTLRTRKSCPGR
jgi:hypothetical protein